MSTLWIFGDSYGAPLSNDDSVHHPWVWHIRLARQLGCSKYRNECQHGVSNEYIQYKISQNAKDIKSEDTVVIISTSITRRWFIYDKPQISNFLQLMNLSDFMDKSHENAVKLYYSELAHYDHFSLDFQRFLGWIHYMSDKNQWNALVIPGFEEEGFPVSHQYTVQGSLFDVSSKEFDSIDTRDWFYSKYCKGYDKRAGHLIKDNHEILSNKIFNTLTSSVPLDLSSEFKTNIITKDNIPAIQHQFLNP